MSHQDEPFHPETVDERIAWLAQREQQDQSQSLRTDDSHLPDEAGARLVRDLLHLASQDADRLARIRERLAEHITAAPKPTFLTPPQNGQEADFSGEKPTSDVREIHSLFQERMPDPDTQEMPALEPATLPSHIAERKRRGGTRQVAHWAQMLAAVLIVGMLLGSLITALALRKQGQLGRQATPTFVPVATPTATLTPIPQVNGSSAYLVDAASGRVLLDVNSHQQVPMWSTTKIMTALLAIERLSLDHVVTVQQAELDEVPDGLSIAWLRATDQMSILHLLYGLLLPSGSDAAVVLAHAVSGTTSSFVALMNARAQQLGLTDTHYMNPFGADAPGHYSSAADLVQLARKAMSYTAFAQIVFTRHYHLDANLSHTTYTWDNILTPFLQGYSGANGIKTGSNDTLNDWCMVFSAARNGRLLIGAEMQAPSEDQVFTDAENILDKGFAS